MHQHYNMLGEPTTKPLSNLLLANTEKNRKNQPKHPGEGEQPPRALEHTTSTLNFRQTAIRTKSDQNELVRFHTETTSSSQISSDQTGCVPLLDKTFWDHKLDQTGGDHLLGGNSQKNSGNPKHPIGKPQLDQTSGVGPKIAPSYRWQPPLPPKECRSKVDRKKAMNKFEASRTVSNKSITPQAADSRLRMSTRNMYEAFGEYIAQNLLLQPNQDELTNTSRSETQ